MFYKGQSASERGQEDRASQSHQMPGQRTKSSELEGEKAETRPTPADRKMKIPQQTSLDPEKQSRRMKERQTESGMGIRLGRVLLD